MSTNNFNAVLEEMNNFVQYKIENANCELKILASETYKSMSPAGYEVEAVLCAVIKDGKIVDGGASIRPNIGPNVDVISYREAKHEAKNMVKRWEKLQKEQALHDRFLDETGGF